MTDPGMVSISQQIKQHCEQVIARQMDPDGPRLGPSRGARLYVNGLCFVGGVSRQEEYFSDRDCHRTTDNNAIGAVPNANATLACAFTH